VVERAAVLEQDAHRQLLVVLQSPGGQFAAQLQQFGRGLAEVDVDRIQLLHRRQRFGLRVKVDNPEGVLMPGMYVRAVVGGGVRNDALLVPMQGIARDPKGNTSAMVVGKDGKVEVRPVKVSRALGDKWLVEEGLKAGDRVIVEGLQKIGPGMPVQATERGAKPARTAATSASAPAPAATSGAR